MKCTRITFEGYKRLADTGCDVGQRLLAFVGQNEAGKTSVLSSLDWLTEDEETPLAPLDSARANRKTSGWIVGAFYALSEDERALLEPLGLAQVPRTFTLWKQADGRLQVAFRDPQEPSRDPGPFRAAEEALLKVQARLAKQLNGPFDDEDENPKAWLDRALDLVREPDAKWASEDKGAAEALAEWLKNPPPNGKNPRAGKAADLVRAAMQIGAEQHPRDVGLRILQERCPKFVLFRDEDRDLPTVSAIDSKAARGAIRPAVHSLLRIAQVDVAELWRAYADSDSGEVQTILANGNERMDAFFGQTWNQSNISVHFDLDQNGLSTHIYEKDHKRYTRIEERSDGLRAFVALAAFVEAQDLDVPPILLIDEAESHLHFDAQADLVGVLLKQVKATQVFYTTHSPGCLPSDLGTGIRLVERTGATSVIKSHFWTNQAPGFGPLLFAMGASAAAFSACRWAVLAEGASDMILLPTLLRLATDSDDIDYQVAPGLANARAYDMDVEEVAAKVVYLTDGDAAGQKYRKDLLDAGIREARIFSLPEGMATEDLLRPDYYLAVVAGMLIGDAFAMPPEVANAGKPIARAIADWGNEQQSQVKIPGKVAVAYAVIARDDIALREEAKGALAELHAGFMAAFGARERQIGNSG